MLKLYSISDVLDTYFPTTGVTLPELTKLVIHHGTYREIGKVKVMMEDDIRLLLACVSARRAKPIEPPPDAAGLIVFVGNPIDHECLVYVAWSPLGQELMLLDQVTEFAQEPVRVLGTADATPRDVKEFKAAHKKSWRFGSWFARTSRFLESVRGLTEGEDAEGEQVEHSDGVSEDAGAESKAAKHPQH